MATINTYSWGTAVLYRFTPAQEVTHEYISVHPMEELPTREPMSTPHKPFRITKKVRTY